MARISMSALTTMSGRGLRADLTILLPMRFAKPVGKLVSFGEEEAGSAVSFSFSDESPCSSSESSVIVLLRPFSFHRLLGVFQSLAYSLPHKVDNEIFLSMNETKLLC
jgi:hypothetical protein